MTTSKVFTAVTDRSGLEPLGPPLSKGDGESIMIAPVGDNPHLLFKQYRPGEGTSADDGDRLDRLIAITRRLDARARQQLASASCWPVSRVIEKGRTVGVLLPRAPDKFNAALRSLTGIGQRKPLAVDWLAKSSDQQAERGLPRASFDQRIKVCRDIAAVAAILEQEGIVYGDWSYANALWSITDFSGYLIDVDACAFGSRPWVATPNWDDPLTPQGTPVDGNTDRYRLAIMVARCLTGERDVAAALDEARAQSLAASRPGIGQVLTRAVNARSRSARPTVAEILQSLTQQPLSNVARWKPVGRGVKQPQPVSAAPRIQSVRPPSQRSAVTRPVTTPSRPASRPAAKPSLPSVASVLIALIVIALVLLGVVLLFR